MVPRYKGLRVPSARLVGYDYASAGWYFVTICTAERAAFFGEVRDGVMGLTEAGCVAHRCWDAIPDHVPRVCLDAFVVMPNHVHGLVGLLPAEAMGADDGETLHATSLRADHRTVDPDPAMSALSPSAGSLSAVVRSYKSAVTRTVRRNGPPHFAWQPRFHDHIVRNERAFQHIRTYILENPARWSEDRYHATHQPPPP